MVIKIVQTRNEASEYVGRGSPLGNPYPMKDASETERNRVCDQYQVWFDFMLANAEPTFMEELNRLTKIAMNGDLSLGCYCAPKRCHGQTIKAYIEKCIK